MAEFEMLGIEEINKKLKQLNAQANRVENKAMREAAKVMHEEIVNRAPRSDKPRQPTKRQKWRTGKHAADILKMSNVRKKRGEKYIQVGLLKQDTSKAFYLKFFEWGTTKIRARPFMEPAMQEKQREAHEVLRNELKKGLGL